MLRYSLFVLVLFVPIFASAVVPMRGFLFLVVLLFYYAQLVLFSVFVSPPVLDIVVLGATSGE